MRLEIKYHDGDSEILEFKQETITIGRGSKCDLRITGEGISREHCQIIQRGGQVFVKDLGSSNGTFLNEEKIAAHEETEFTTFFPIIIGTGNSIALLSEDDGMFAGAPKTTLSRQKTNPQISSLLASNPTEYRPTGKSVARGVPTQDEESTNPGFDMSSNQFKKVRGRRSQNGNKNQAMLLILVVAAAAYYFMFMQEEEIVVQPAPKITTPKPVAKVAKEEAPVEVKYEAKTVFDWGKCLTDHEKSYCSFFTFHDYYEGFVIKGDTLFAVIHSENQISNFTFSHQMNEDENAELSRLKNIEERAKARNTNFSGFDAAVATKAEAASLSLIFHEGFFEQLKNDPTINKIYFVSFSRKEGLPEIQSKLEASKADVLQVAQAEFLAAFKMLLIANHAQLYTTKVVPIIKPKK